MGPQLRGTLRAGAIKIELIGREVNPAGVTLSTSDLTIDEGASGIYTVVLATQPDADVTITPTGTGLTFTPASLTFTTLDWDTAKTITVAVDQDDNLAAETITITHAVTGYGTITTADSVTVNTTDNDTASVTVNPTMLTVNEESTETYSVVLDYQPESIVTVTIIPPTGSDVSVTSTHTLTFTTSNWATAQVVTVAAADDDDRTNDSATIRHTASQTSVGNEYNGISVDSVAVTVDDDDAAGVTVTPTSLMNIDEGSSVEYTIKLDTVPSVEVTVNISPSADSGVTTNKTSLTFTSGNFGTPQTVTVTASEDDDAFDNTGSITHTVSGFGSVTTATAVSVSVVDDETAAVVPSVTTLDSGTHTLTLDEGGNVIYKLGLASEPVSGEVTVTIHVPDETDITATPVSLIFIDNDWNKPKTVLLEAVEDADAVDDVVTITHTVSGADYDGVTAPNLVVTVTDNDTANLRFSTNILAVDEANADTTTTYTVELTTQPTANVVVTLTPPSNTDVTISPELLDFITTNWNSPQTVAVTVKPDDDAADEPAIIAHSASGGDYIGKTGSVDVNVNDDEVATVSTSSNALRVGEESSITYTVMLSAKPTADVTVNISVPTPGTDVGVDPETLTFTPNDFGSKTVTVRAGDDHNGDPDTARINHVVSGAAEYDGYRVSDVIVTVTDNDEAGVTISKSSFDINEGASNTYTVKLDTEPSGDEVTVTPIVGTGLDVSVLPASLTFTDDDWNNAQTVTASAAPDPDARDDTGMITHMVTGYGSVSADSIDVTVIDPDEAVVSITPTSLTIEEGDTTGMTYAVTLDSRPISSMGIARAATVTITSSNQNVKLSQSSLNFKQWAATRTIRVTAVSDDDAVNNKATLSHSVSTANLESDYNGLDIADVDVTVTDPDEPDLEISSTSVTDVPEGGAVGTYTIKPATEPSGEFTVMVASDNDVVQVPSQVFRFNAGNWTVAQEIPISAIEDDDAFNDTATITHTVYHG